MITGLSAGFGQWNALSTVMTITDLALSADLNGANPQDLANKTEIQRLLKLAVIGGDRFAISGVVSEIWGDVEQQIGSLATTFGNDMVSMGKRRPALAKCDCNDLLHLFLQPLAPTATM